MMVNQVFNPLTFALGDTDLNVELTVIHAMFTQKIVALKMVFILNPFDNCKDCYNGTDKCSIVGYKSPTSDFCNLEDGSCVYEPIDNCTPLRCSISGIECSKAIMIKIIVAVIMVKVFNCKFHERIKNKLEVNPYIFVSTDLCAKWVKAVATPDYKAETTTIM
ncbi:hypothetical protein ACTA71_011329 [Dictyostelium dimigraforme]